MLSLEESDEVRQTDTETDGLPGHGSPADGVAVAVQLRQDSALMMDV